MRTPAKPFERIEDPSQLELVPLLEAPMTNAERQRRYREKQRKNGRKPVTLLVTEDERFYLERVLQAMREQGATPALLRNAKGQFKHLDV